MKPWYIVGFTDGEGSFSITISKHKTKRLGLDARLMFEIELRGDDKPLLLEIQQYFKCGQIYDLNYDRYGWKPHVKYAVKNLKDITRIIIPFFKKYQLKGKKAKDFQLFCQAADLFKDKKHLTKDGIEKLYSLREFMNNRRPMNK
ncbi:MAG: LAGLIDADG family homing endonuclease [Candidatus Daviesbacteria bacterium]|nr:LAGLIDADG family homing endonuclease [Candidatus Daviesbacteria bacterium]